MNIACLTTHLRGKQTNGFGTNFSRCLQTSFSQTLIGKLHKCETATSKGDFEQRSILVGVPQLFAGLTDSTRILDKQPSRGVSCEYQ